MKARNVINTLLMGKKKNFKKTILEKTTLWSRLGLLNNSAFTWCEHNHIGKGGEGRIMKMRILKASFKDVWKSYF